MENLEDINAVDEEGYRPFTKDSLNALRIRKAQLEDNKSAERPSAAKQCIFKAINEFWKPNGVVDDEFSAIPDPSLEDGQELPQYYGKFPKELYNQILEDVDVYYKQRGLETFCVVSRKFGKNYVCRFSATKGFFVFSPFLFLRQLAIRTILHPAFDTIVMAIILVNCVFLALDNEIANAEYVFTGLYTIEMLIKMVARGFIVNNFTYLRDPWNWLDFVVVILAYAAFFGTANVSSLRTFRVFRAFKSVSIIPGLKTIVNALFHSMKPLSEVMLIMGFLLIVVALIALQAFMGVLRRRCVLVPPEGIQNVTLAYATNQSNWKSYETDEEEVCGTSAGAGLCPTNYACMNDVGPNPNYGYTNFDNMAYALLTSFQLLTLDRWENVYNLIIRAEGPWNVLFFLMSVFLGPFYLLNLLLAVVTLAYSREHEKQEELEQMRVQAKERARRKNQRKKKLAEQKILHLNTISPDDHPSIFNVVSQISSTKGNDVDHNSSAESKIVNLTNDNGTTDVGQSSLNDASEGAKSRREMFKSHHQDTSMDSADSSKAELKGIHLKWHNWKKWYMKTFCSWNCSPCFKRFQRKLKRIIEHKYFEILVMICIICNTIFLAIDYHLITPELEAALSVGNKVFTAAFTVEAVLKLLAMGPIEYAKDLWNDFDFIIVFISLVELGLELSGGASANTGLSVLRTLRLLRVFRLARMWGTMYKLISIIWKSISAVGYLTVVLFLVLYIFAVIGKQLYGIDYLNSKDKFEGSIPRWSFIDFYHSFLLVWRVMCGEWIEPLYDCLHTTNGNGLCIVYFLCILVFANFMILNLFTAILLEAFSVDDLKGKQEKSDKENKKVKAAKKGVEAFKRLRQHSHNEESPGSEPNEVDHQNEPNGDGGNTSSAFDSEVRVSHSSTNMFELTKVVTLRQNSRNAISPSDEPFIQTPDETQFSDELGRNLHKNTISSTMPMIEESIGGLTCNQPNNYNSTVDQDTTFTTSNGGANHNQISTPEKKSKFWCGSICCCCGANIKKTAPMNVQSDVISVTSDDERTIVSVISIDEESQENDANEPPHCLPKHLRTRFPVLSKTPTCQAYKLWWNIRRACFCLVEHKFFEWFILFLILASTICLAMEDKFLDADPLKKHILQKLEYVFTALFTLEMLLKWIGIGPTKYFTSVWCVLDCAIVAVSWAGIILQAASRASQTGAFRSLRTLRALRPLRAVSRWQGMKVVVNALIYCIPSIGNVLCVCLLIWFVFSIMGVQFFKGQFFRCVDANDEELPWPDVRNITDCLHQNYTWVNRNINFDNVINGMIALFQVATFEGWIEVMADASDVAGVDNQPVKEGSQYYMIFFVLFVLVGSFFILNLIVGVIIESFQKLRKGTDSSSAVEALLTDNQKKFYKTMKTMLNRKPKKTIPPPKNACQKHVFKIVNHSRFELGIFVLIVLNMLTLSMEHYQMSQQWVDSLRIADIAFTSLFVLEAFFKLFAMRFHYFKDVFNVFDFVVIVVSVIGLILENLVSILVSPTLLRVVRVFRIFRVLRVVRAARGIRRLILTLMISIPALFNIAILLGVFLVIFAILGMTSFSNVKLSGSLNDQVNFQTFGNSLMVLFRLVTSAGWNDVLDPLMNTRDCTPSTQTQVGDCGDPVLAVIYFILFIFIVFLVVVNMYIAIILENFGEIFEQDEGGVSQGDFETFYMVWGRYDPKATQFVTLEELSNLLHDLHPPFQLQKPNLVKIGALNLPVLHGDKVHCLDVLFALVKRILGEVEISKDMKEEAEMRLFKSFPNRKSLKAETTTLLLRQQTRAAKVIQHAWKSYSLKRKGFSMHSLLSPGGLIQMSLPGESSRRSSSKSQTNGVKPKITFSEEEEEHKAISKKKTSIDLTSEDHEPVFGGEGSARNELIKASPKSIAKLVLDDPVSNSEKKNTASKLESNQNDNNNASNIKKVYDLLHKDMVHKSDHDETREISQVANDPNNENTLSKHNKIETKQPRPKSVSSTSYSLSGGAFAPPLSSSRTSQPELRTQSTGNEKQQEFLETPQNPLNSSKNLVHTKQLQNFVSPRPVQTEKQAFHQTNNNIKPETEISLRNDMIAETEFL